MVKGSDVLFDDAFPHGSVDGFDRGCKGGHCPAAIACRDVKRRYGSDLDFRRLVDAGATLEEIVAIDLAAAETDAALERRRRRGLPDEAPLTVDAADAAEARRPKPSPPAVRPEHLVKPVEWVPCGRGPCAAEEGHEGTCAEASGFEEEAAPEAVPAKDLTLAPRPPKWEVRKVWMAIAPDGVAHGPFDGQQDGLAYVSAQFPTQATAPTQEPSENVTEAQSESAADESAGAAPARRQWRRWSAEEIATAKRMWRDGATDRAIADAIGRLHGTVSPKLRSLGLAPNGRAFKKSPTA